MLSTWRVCHPDRSSKPAKLRAIISWPRPSGPPSSSALFVYVTSCTESGATGARDSAVRAPGGGERLLRIMTGRPL
jgi:hypothetical protein